MLTVVPSIIITTLVVCGQFTPTASKHRKAKTELGLEGILGMSMLLVNVANVMPQCVTGFPRLGIGESLSVKPLSRSMAVTSYLLSTLERYIPLH